MRNLRRIGYNFAMKQCERDGCETYTNNRKFCSVRCSNIAVPRRKQTSQRRILKPCINCKNSTLNAKFCSNKCQMLHQYQTKVQKWLDKEIQGIVIMATVHRYLRETRGERCEECGWARRHPTTGHIPLTIDHIDGDWQNCSYENLRLLCGSCHSLTPTFGYLNSNMMRVRMGLEPISVSRRTAGVM